MSDVEIATVFHGTGSNRMPDIKAGENLYGRSYRHISTLSGTLANKSEVSIRIALIAQKLGYGKATVLVYEVPIQLLRIAGGEEHSSHYYMTVDWVSPDILPDAYFAAIHVERDIVMERLANRFDRFYQVRSDYLRNVFFPE
jgi:hypothetical protein